MRDFGPSREPIFTITGPKSQRQGAAHIHRYCQNRSFRHRCQLMRVLKEEPESTNLRGHPVQRGKGLSPVARLFFFLREVAGQFQSLVRPLDIQRLSFGGRRVETASTALPRQAE